MRDETFSVLLIEDDPDFSEMVKLNLESEPATPYSVESADTLAKGLAALEKKKYRALLLDLTLPDAKEMEGLTRLREQNPDIPIVVITGHSDEKRARAALQKGAQDYLQKPLPPSEIDRALRYAAERQDTLQRLRESEARLTASQRMEAVGCLAGGIAHDFNNILTIISAHTSFIRDQIKSGHTVEGVLADLDEISRSSSRAANLTKQLLVFSKNKRPRLAPLDLNHTIRGVERMLERTLGEDIKFISSLSPDLHQVMADAGQLEQVLLNIFINARDAMPHGGKLVTQTQNITTTPEDAYDLPPGTYAFLSIADTGCGMNEETRSKIFDPFFTTKGTRGTGLGLSTAYSIIQQNGGEIRVESVVGRGTTFKIFFPMLAADTRPAGNNTHIAPPRRGSETILVVEDETVVRRVARRVLEKNGYTVCCARNGEEAIEIFRARKNEIDLLVTDVIMPGLTGPHLAERLAQIQPEVKVLFMSGYPGRASEEEILVRSGSKLLDKPFSSTDLLWRVREAIDSGGAWTKVRG